MALALTKQKASFLAYAALRQVFTTILLASTCQHMPLKWLGVKIVAVKQMALSTQ